MTFLAQLVVLPAGYRVRGVYGWAHANDFELLAGTYAWEELLGDLAKRGLTNVHAASLPAAARPACLYRITQPGMDAVARALGERPPRVPPPGPMNGSDGVYVSPGGRLAMEALRRCDGWLATDEMRTPSATWAWPAECTWPIVFPGDLDALVASGLAVSRTGCDGSRRPANRLFRATRCGRRVALLEWFGRHPESPVYTDAYGKPVLRSVRAGFLFGSGN
jgi:hypothetical protein